MPSSTPINHSLSAGQSSGPSWEDVLNSIDKTRPIAFFAHHYADAAKTIPSVLLGRSCDVQLATPTAVWEKQYPKTGKGDLSCFNQHEKNMLDVLKTAQHCVQFVDFRDVGRSSLFVAGQGLQPTLSTPMLRTTDMGPTLKQWLKWSFVHQHRRYQHIFHLSGNYLRFARGALIALNEAHEKGMVTVDGNTGNWCIDATYSHLTGAKAGVRIEPVWAKVCIIDVGFALHPSYPPPRQLPINSDGMSPCMQRATEEIEAQARSAFYQLTPEQRSKGGWTNEIDAMADVAFWTTHASTATRHYEQVDWRQDYWWLGSVLRQLCKGGEDTLYHPVLDIRELLGSFNDGAEATGGLAQELVNLGEATFDYDIEPDITQRRALADAKRLEIHTDLIARLDAAIGKLRPQDDVRHIDLYRADFDVDDATRHEKEQAAPAEQALNQAEKQLLNDEGEQQRAEHHARYWGVAKNIARALGAAAVVGGSFWGVAVVGTPWVSSQWYAYREAELAQIQAPAVQRLLDGITQNPGAVSNAKATLYAGTAMKAQNQFFTGDLFQFTATNPLPHEGYLTLFAADAQDEKSQRVAVPIANQPIAAGATITCPGKATCDDGYADGNRPWPVTGPAGTVRMLAVITPARINWPLAPGQEGQPRHIAVTNYQGTQDITALFNCTSQSGAAQQACQNARQNFAVSPVVAYEVTDNKLAAPAAVASRPSTASAASTATQPMIELTTQSSLLHGRYQIVADGSEVKDVQTGLTWARCSVGQRWENGVCVGSAKKFSFDGAQKLAGNGWRVPKVRELRSLVWCSSGKTTGSTDPQDGLGAIYELCDEENIMPTLRKRVFPSSYRQYWTSSPDMGFDDAAWLVDFDSGYVGSNAARSSHLYVRLVRTNQ
ncbi:hypothetical protein AEP_01649 [Curvibacter sp. AEP1-3]|uniref:Lcl C-terminal domain-containing protein n=1 Tax=Curvibacter sp. AEP1-3 TaxID=1844971 RepID=UPI000B3C129E|nr:DUF1566 domain-containing protein [Curvibacter sp. AEP1-3]ARV18593.1 hypothetical protein AEP_01649 [Curvibacter sp. AEP1-3]